MSRWETGHSCKTCLENNPPIQPRQLRKKSPEARIRHSDESRNPVFLTGYNLLDPGAYPGPDPGFTWVTTFCELIDHMIEIIPALEILKNLEKLLS